jgi:UDP-N-acetyl-D-glucosamine dehydrogenase
VNAVVVALGKVGLPLAVQIAWGGHRVVGCDIDERVLEHVNAGRAPFPGEDHLDERLRRVVGDGRLRAQRDTVAAVADAPDLVVAVPPLYVDADARPDWGALDAVIDAIGAGLQRGTTVVVETTAPVGTTRERVAPRLEQASGLTAEHDFHVAFSPERVFSGRVFRDLATYPKLVGGLSEPGEQRAAELYREFIDGAEVWPMGSAEAAELAKLAETTYRDLNIAFANELARAADVRGLDVERVIDAANSQPFSHIHRPGVAVGGHCIPVYPRFFLEGAPDARLPRVAREVNEAMPAYAADLLGDVAGKRVLVLGIAYRGGVKEDAFSGARALRTVLRDRGAHAVFADPLYADDELRAGGYEPWDGAPVDAAIVQADHAEYAELAAADLPGVRQVVDGRGVVDPAKFDGIPVTRIGRP